MESKQATYDAVSTMEDRDELLSSTEVEDSLMGDEEKRWRRGDPRSRRPKRSLKEKLETALRSPRWLVTTILQLVIICLLLLVLLQDRWTAASSNSYQVGDDISGPGAKIPTKVIKFDADRSFVPTNASELLGAAVLEKWKTMLPTKTGWGEPDYFSTTTMTHQLHCLYMMGRIYAGLTTGGVTGHLATEYDLHFLHCIDYLRQGVMCAGDLALEPHTPDDPDDLGPLDGSWGGRHVCKDYGQLTQYLDEQIADGVRVVLPFDD